MNAPRREIPIIDLWTGEPWVPEPAGDPETDPALDGASVPVLDSAPQRGGNAGPQIAAHRLVDATAIDLADVRAERRRRCRRTI